MNRMKTMHTRTWTKVIAAALFAASPILGQIPAYWNRGTVEAGAFGGFATGLGRTAAGVGGNIAVAATTNVMPYFETTFFPDLLNRTAAEKGFVQSSGQE